ncbi:colicin V production protein [Ruminiclostridium sufflavum DSM 19573]|uniref:Colicin V production protein n=1 Tax=Ruminiclostridium sufflavum DSM 19573 TaxID=1121337 RepID=A0A318XQ85_9FIRM|nr:CvpA family protein [Ruminiclostridium sufflavum]PYG89438.1 colicin V production protein [Ruminiclostridium sufflavum DSM 19573]
MNWTDIAVFIIIAGFMVIGLKNGFLYSVFRLVSYVLSVIFAIKFYPVISDILQQTVLFTNIKAAVISGIVKGRAGDAAVFNGDSARTAIIDGLKLPAFIKESINNKIIGQDIFGVNKIMDMIGSEIAMLVINILSVILIYVIIRCALALIKVVIKTISRLPVFKQLDKTGGIVLGAIEGILAIYILCAVLVLFSAFPKFGPAIESIEGSKFANYFYQNNFIVSWIAPEEELNS